MVTWSRSFTARTGPAKRCHASSTSGCMLQWNGESMCVRSSSATPARAAACPASAAVACPRRYVCSRSLSVLKAS